MFKVVTLFQSPIYGSRTRLRAEPFNKVYRFNPLSTGHAQALPLGFFEVDDRFNPLSTGHALLQCNFHILMALVSIPYLRVTHLITGEIEHENG
mgnify:CR=1 FL=1